MKIAEIKSKIAEGALSGFGLYRDGEAAKERFLRAIDSFVSLFGDEREIYVLSVSGRSELLGNHTDHNNGRVLAGAIDRDIIAIAAKRDDGVVSLKSEGYDADVVDVKDCSDPKAFEDFSSAALIAGVANGFEKRGYKIGGFDAYTTSDVLKGSGISSSAAYEVMIGNIFNHLYNGGVVENTTVAKVAQYAENVYFGKPSGLMDQMACAVGGFVYIDFENKNEPKIEPISLSLKDHGYELCIVNTGGNHADLNDDYASVPREMRAVAALLGREVLAGVSECDLISEAKKIRREAGDRALLRALHFVRENRRVDRGRDALASGDIEGFFKTVLSSGHSSFEYLQNVYTNKNAREQGLSLALALTDGFGEGVGAYRVHGGGFAGTIQAYVKCECADEYARLMNSVFGEGAVMRLNVRPVGATRLF
ncbi:MAG: galactokinase [Clostridia bacterium]|nr:galactokinase [Clostridia bacterium]